MPADHDPRERAKPRGRRWLGLGLKLALAVALLLLVVTRIDWTEFRGVIVGANWPWLFLVMLAALGDRCWMAGKWWYLLRGLDVQVRFVDALRHYLVGGLIGMALQWQLGGDLARAGALGHQVRRHKLAVASVVFEKLAGAAASGLLATIAILLLVTRVDLEGWMRGLLVVPGLVTLGCLLLPVIVFSPRAMEFIASWRVWRRLHVDARLRQFAEMTDRLADCRALAFKFLLLTIGEQFVPLLNLFLLTRAFDLPIQPVELLMIMPIITFFSRLPISIDSIGVREGLYVILFQYAGWTTAQSFATAITARVIDLIVVAVGSLILVTRHSRASRLGAEES